MLNFLKEDKKMSGYGGKKLGKIKARDEKEQLKRYVPIPKKGEKEGNQFSKAYKAIERLFFK